MKKASAFPKILLYRLPTDMRKQSNGLASVVEAELGENPFSETMFIFSNRRRDILKVLYFDRAGFCLWVKKLDQSRFPWPSKDHDECFKVSPKDFELMIDGVDVFKRHKKLNFDPIF